MRVCTSEPTSQHVDMARGRREKVAENEPRILVLLSLVASLTRHGPTYRFPAPALKLVHILSLAPRMAKSSLLVLGLMQSPP